jgi:hypothetical protein
MIRPNQAKCGILSAGLIALLFFSGCTSHNNESAVSEIHEGDRLASFSQEITSPIQQFTVKAGTPYMLAINVKNTGTQSWFGGAHAMSVDAGYRWHDSKGAVLPLEGNRALLNRPVVQPGGSDQLKLQVVAPPVPGSYTLWISMVQEGVAWFFDEGTKPLILPVVVE